MKNHGIVFLNFCGNPRSWDIPFNFVSVPYLLNHLKDFHLASHKCSLGAQW